jgi:hypothetical protein
MTEQIEMQCSTCRWWDDKHQFTTAKGDQLASGQAKPPRVVEKNDKIHTVWPTTRDDQRCGGWRGVPSE